MPSLIEYRQATARELGVYQSGVVDTTGTTISLLSNKWPIKTNLPTDQYLDQYLLRCRATPQDRLRIVAEYYPAEGRLVPDLPWTSAPAVAEPYEIHGLLPPDAVEQAINETLKRLPIVVEFSMHSASAQGVRHSVESAAPWLTNEHWVRQVGVLGSGQTDRTRFTPRPIRGQPVKIGGKVYLEMGGLNPSDTIYVVAVKPAYYECYDDGAARAGLVSDDDTAVPSVRWVSLGAVAEIWRLYGHMLEQNTSQRLIKDLGMAAAMFTTETAKNFAMPEQTFWPSAITGFGRSGWGA